MRITTVGAANGCVGNHDGNSEVCDLPVADQSDDDGDQVCNLNRQLHQLGVGFEVSSHSSGRGAFVVTFVPITITLIAKLPETITALR